jgi:peptide/nickel transport system permease protein
VAVFVIRRLLLSLLTLGVSSFVVYVLVAHSGDPLSDLRTDTGPGQELKVARRIELLHLDEPVPQRYVTWLGGVGRCLIPGRGCDFGRTVREQDVGTLLGQAATATVRLVAAALVLAVLLGVSVGVVSALRPRSGFDHAATVAALLFFSLPVFWVAVLLKQYLAIGVNDWYADPRIGPAAAGLAALACGAVGGGVLGGGRRRRWAARGVAAAVTFGLLEYLSIVDWFRYPSLGAGPVGCWRWRRRPGWRGSSPPGRAAATCCAAVWPRRPSAARRRSASHPGWPGRPGRRGRTCCWWA